MRDSSDTNSARPPVETTGVEWVRRGRISVPSEEGVFAFRTIDWIRIRRCLARIKPTIPLLQISYSLLFGVFISTGLSLQVIPVTEITSVYVIPLYQCVTVFSLFISIVFFVLDREKILKKRDDVQGIIDDMKDIEDTIEELQDIPQLYALNGKVEVNKPNQPD